MTGEHVDEGTAAQLLGGELAPAEAERVHAHVAGCRECEQFVAALARVAVSATEPRASTTELPRGATIGRFIVLERIGAGGMGVVHAAYDPELDRRVALKLLRDPDGDVRVRLLREAQAAARLSHPNVVSVFDIGVHQDSVYLAMELVDGVTLTEWLRGEHAWQDVVDMFVQAGRGLVAAHDAGIVHRDFKPDNVLVGRDGRPRVVDFGLARAAEDGGAADPEPRDTRPVAHSFGSRLTRTGAVLGTPRYMAPEQFTGGEITPATDQFGFCVALYQALYGTTPFPGDRVADISTSVLAGVIAPPVATPGPARLRRAIVRGLAVEPAQRHGSLAALLRELERARGARRRRAAIAGGVAAAALLASGAFVLALRLGRGDTEAACGAAGDKVATVWDGERAARLRTAFAKLKLPFGELAARRAIERLDAYAAGWAAMRAEACTATHVEHEQSSQLFDLRVACLDERLAELGALAAAFEAADGETVRHAIEAAGALPPLARCADRAALLAPIRPPDAAIAGRVAAVTAGLAKASTLDGLGKYAAAQAAAERACAGVDALGYAPLVARCRYHVGEFTDRATGDHRRAAQLLTDAIARAIESNDPERAGTAAVQLARVLGLGLEHRDDAERWAQVAEGAATRLSDRSDLDARLADLRGQLAVRAGKPADALPHFERLLALRERSDPKGGVGVANAHVSLGHALTALTRFADAEAHYRRALGVVEELSGANHPNLNPVLDGLGGLQWSQGRPADAIPYFERALAITRASVAPGHPAIVGSLASLAVANADAGNTDRALALLEEAQKSLAPDDRRHRALILTNLVDVHQRRGEHGPALVAAEEALAITRELDGADHPDTAQAQFNLGDALLSNKRAREAVAAIRAALAIWERTLPAGHRYFTIARTALGDALWHAGDPRGAIAPLEAAQADPRARFMLAEVLWSTRGDRKRARTLAATTAAELRKDPAADRTLLAEIEKWLAAR